LDIQKSKHPAWLKIRFKTNTKLENRPFEDVSPKNQCDFPACHVSELVFSTMILRSDENFHPFVQIPDLHPSEFVHAHQWVFFDLLVTFQFNQQQLFFWVVLLGLACLVGKTSKHIPTKLLMKIGD